MKEILYLIILSLRFGCSLGHVDEAMKLVEEASYNKYDLEWVKQVKVNLNYCIAVRRRGEWNDLLNAIGYPSSAGSFLPYAWPEVIFTKSNNILSEKLTMRMP